MPHATLQARHDVPLRPLSVSCFLLSFLSRLSLSIHGYQSLQHWLALESSSSSSLLACTCSLKPFSASVYSTCDFNCDNSVGIQCIDTKNGQYR